MEEKISETNLGIDQALTSGISGTVNPKTEMEKSTDLDFDLSQMFSNEISAPHHSKTELEKKSGSNLRSIHLSGDRFIIKDEAPIRSYEVFKFNESPNDELPGVFCQGIQYYDLKHVYFINNTGMANLIDLLKSLLQKDVEVQFVNVCDKIKNKIKALGLDHIIICS